MNPIPCIRINNLSKRYKKSDEDCLKQISFDIFSGEKFGLLGPNGAGKTTLISILCGILLPGSGNYEYLENGIKINSNSIKNKIGFVPQEYAFYDELSPLQNIEYFGALYNLSKSA